MKPQGVLLSRRFYPVGLLNDAVTAFEGAPIASGAARVAGGAEAISARLALDNKVTPINFRVDNL